MRFITPAAAAGAAFLVAVLFATAGHAEPPPTEINSASPACQRLAEEARRDGSPTALAAFADTHPECQEEVAEIRGELLWRWKAPSADGDIAGASGRTRNTSAQLTVMAIGRPLARAAPMTAVAGGYGVILAHQGDPRLADTCRAFLAAIEFSRAPDDGRPITIDRFRLYRRPIYWPIIDPMRPAAKPCETLVQTYDFTRAAPWINHYGLGGRSGPFVVMVRDDGEKTGVFDFSNVPTRAFARQFTRFQKAISNSREDVWSQSFYDDGNIKQWMQRFLEINDGRFAIIAQLVGVPPVASAEAPVRQ